MPLRDKLTAVAAGAFIDFVASILTIHYWLG